MTCSNRCNGLSRLGGRFGDPPLPLGRQSIVPALRAPTSCAAGPVAARVTFADSASRRCATAMTSAVHARKITRQ
jgi:hypothetical protein